MAEGQPGKLQSAQMRRGMGVERLDRIIEEVAAGPDERLETRREDRRVRGGFPRAGQVIEPAGLAVEVPFAGLGQRLKQVVDVVAGERAVAIGGGGGLVEVEGGAAGEAEPARAGIQLGTREPFLDPLMQEDKLRVGQRGPGLHVAGFRLEGVAAGEESAGLRVLDLAEMENVAGGFLVGGELGQAGPRGAAAVDEQRAEGPAVRRDLRPLRLPTFQPVRRWPPSKTGRARGAAT